MTKSIAERLYAHLEHIHPVNLESQIKIAAGDGDSGIESDLQGDGIARPDGVLTD